MWQSENFHPNLRRVGKLLALFLTMHVFLSSIALALVVLRKVMEIILGRQNDVEFDKIAVVPL